MASSKPVSFSKPASIFFFLLFLNIFTFAAGLSVRSTATRTDLPGISKCLSDSSVSAASVCMDATIEIDSCLCAMVKSVAPKADFANCVESCSQDERNKLREICGAGNVGSNGDQKKVVSGSLQPGAMNLASTSPKDDDDDDGDNNDDDEDDEDDEDDQPAKPPPVTVGKNNSTTTNNNSTTTKLPNTKDKKGGASFAKGNPGWTGIGVAVVAIVLIV